MINNNKILILLFLITLIGGILRIYHLTNVPSSLHGDELGLGYNAYSLLKTGKDEYGRILPLFFRNDFTPLVFYLAIPFIGILGLTEFSTRLPAVFFSIITIPVIYLFVKTIFRKNKLALLTSLFVALSSWDIRLARITVGINIPLLLQISATILFFKAKQFKSINKKYLIYSFLLFLLSTIAYQSPKMTTPLIIFGLFCIYKSELSIKKNFCFYVFLFFIFILLPTIHYLTLLPVEKMRFSGISVFTLWRSTLVNKTSLVSYLLPVNLFKLFRMIFINYIKHFDPKILFFDNSNLRYHQLPFLGLFYPWQIIFIIIGIFSSLKLFYKKEMKFIFYWLLISPSASALTSGVPYANVSRALMMLPVIEIFCAAGVISTINIIKKLQFLKLNFLFCLLLIVIFSLNLIFFNQIYFIKTAKDNSFFWGAHLKEMARFILPYEKVVNKIIISDSLSPQTYMYILFYGKKEPSWLFRENGKKSDILGYSSFGKYEIRSINWNHDRILKNTIIVGTASEIPGDSYNIVKQISESDGNILIRIVQTPN